MARVQIPLAKFKAAIFDMDGTMINNSGAHIRAWQEFAKRHNVELSEAEYRRKVAGKKNDQIVKTLFGDMSPEETQRLGDEKEVLYRELYAPDIEAVRGLHETVNELERHGLRLAIATTANKANREFVLDALGLQDRFELVLGEEHVSHGKPHPEIYLSAAQKLGVEPAECLVFEDSPSGVAAAKEAGMTVAGLLTLHTPEELKQADYTVSDFTDVEFE